MKRKMIAVVFLVVVCAGLLVVQGVSQSPPPTTASSAPVVPQSPTTPPTPSFNRIDPRIDAPPQQEWTFEQLAEALKGVRARQKELKAQEADILVKMADKIEEKRRDLLKAEEVLRQLQEHPAKMNATKQLIGKREEAQDKQKASLPEGRKLDFQAPISFPSQP